jgi:hypothetical protein
MSGPTMAMLQFRAGDLRDSIAARCREDLPPALVAKRDLRRFYELIERVDVDDLGFTTPEWALMATVDAVSTIRYAPPLPVATVWCSPPAL